MNYWLFKTEPGCFSFDDLKNRPDMTEPWDGVRNFQARNFLRDTVAVGDLVLFYHSNIAEPAVVGVAEIVRAGFIFSGIGLVAFVYGKKEGSYKPLSIGIALMAYPYFLTSTFWLYAVGSGLCLLLYFWRD